MSFQWIYFLVFAALAYFVTSASCKSSSFIVYSPGKPSLGVAIGSFASTLGGVLLSYFAFLKHFELSRANIAGALAATFIANYASYAALKDKNHFDVQDFFLFVKEGFLWVTAYPGVAAALGLSGVKFTG